MARTTVSLDDEKQEQAKAAGLNISQLTREAIDQRLRLPDHHMVNTNQSNLPGDATGTAIYAEGVVATYGPKDPFGEHLENIERRDWVHSYQNGAGVRAAGIVLEDGTSDPVAPEDMIFHSASSNANEYHVPVRWQVVVEERSAVTSDEIDHICGRPLYASTYNEVQDDDNPELLLDVLFGRDQRS